uniref:Basigin n=1 Tax=Aceria tosichella TaxID=561515 RepID=A0A6G1SAK8_9ACAR
MSSSMPEERPARGGKGCNQIAEKQQNNNNNSSSIRLSTYSLRTHKTKLILLSSLWLILTHPLKPIDSATIVIQPNNKAATLVPGQPLHFECAQVGNDGKKPQFVWYKRNLNAEESQQPLLLDPNQDDTIEIHNERLTLLKPNYQSVGDYICSALDDKNESETIQVRAAPYVEDFGVETSHTGKSATLNDGDRLELNCRVRDQSVPVNITWLMSNSPDNDYSMVAVPEYDPGQMPSSPNQQMSAASAQDALVVPTYTMPNNVMVERTDSFSKRLIIRQLGPEHRGYYTCMVDNNVTERTRKTIYIRVKDKILPLWPFLGILAELFILFTIIYVWETQKAQKSIVTNPKSGALGAAALRGGGPMPPQTPGSTSGAKRAASGPSNAFESVPLNG